MSKTSNQIMIARIYEEEGSHALALMHLNAAAVFASYEEPQHIPQIREVITNYRTLYLAQKWT